MFEKFYKHLYKCMNIRLGTSLHLYKYMFHLKVKQVHKTIIGNIFIYIYMVHLSLKQEHKTIFGNIIIYVWFILS